MAVTTAQFLMADRLAGGELADILRRERAAGKGFEKISRYLDSEYGIVVTAQTLTNWADTLGIPTGRLAKVRTLDEQAS